MVGCFFYAASLRPIRYNHPMTTRRTSSPRVILGEGKYYNLVREGTWEFITPQCFSDVVMIVPLLDDGRIVLVEQYRPPLGRSCLELPAGLVGDGDSRDGEDILVAAQRELIEETGYDAASFELVLRGAPSAGSNTLELGFVLATGLTKIAVGGGLAHEGENITVHEVPLAEVDEFLAARAKSGYSVDLKTYVGLYIARQHMGEF